MSNVDKVPNAAAWLVQNLTARRAYSLGGCGGCSFRGGTPVCGVLSPYCQYYDEGTGDVLFVCWLIRGTNACGAMLRECTEMLNALSLEQRDDILNTMVKTAVSDKKR